MQIIVKQEFKGLLIHKGSVTCRGCSPAKRPDQQETFGLLRFLSIGAGFQEPGIGVKGEPGEYLLRYIGS